MSDKLSALRDAAWWSGFWFGVMMIAALLLGAVVIAARLADV